MGDLGGLAKLFEINFAPSYHYNLPNPYGFRPGTELQPIANAGGGVLANTRSQLSMPYLTAFQDPTQTNTGSIWSSLGTGLETILPSIFGGMKSPTTARTPPTVPTRGTPGPGNISTIPTMHAPGAKIPRATKIGLGAAAAGVGAAIAGYHFTHTGKMVKNRHMNPCNGRAVRRAIRRVFAFERVAKRVLRIAAPHHHIKGVRRPKRRR